MDVTNYPKYHKIIVPITSIDSNAAMLIGATMKALRKAGVAPDEVEAFRTEATSGDYDNVIQTIMRWVTVE